MQIKVLQFFKLQICNFTSDLLSFGQKVVQSSVPSVRQPRQWIAEGQAPAILQKFVDPFPHFLCSKTSQKRIWMNQVQRSTISKDLLLPMQRFLKMNIKEPGVESATMRFSTNLGFAIAGLYCSYLNETCIPFKAFLVLSYSDTSASCIKCPFLNSPSLYYGG